MALDYVFWLPPLLLVLVICVVAVFLWYLRSSNNTSVQRYVTEEQGGDDDGAGLFPAPLCTVESGTYHGPLVVEFYNPDPSFQFEPIFIFIDHPTQPVDEMPYLRPLLLTSGLYNISARHHQRGMVTFARFAIIDGPIVYSSKPDGMYSKPMQMLLLSSHTDRTRIRAKISVTDPLTGNQVHELLLEDAGSLELPKPGKYTIVAQAQYTSQDGDVIDGPEAQFTYDVVGDDFESGGLLSISPSSGVVIGGVTYITFQNKGESHDYDVMYDLHLVGPSWGLSKSIEKPKICWDEKPFTLPKVKDSNVVVVFCLRRKRDGALSSIHWTHFHVVSDTVAPSAVVNQNVNVENKIFSPPLSLPPPPLPPSQPQPIEHTCKCDLTLKLNVAPPPPPPVPALPSPPVVSTKDEPTQTSSLQVTQKPLVFCSANDVFVHLSYEKPHGEIKYCQSSSKENTKLAPLVPYTDKFRLIAEETVCLCVAVEGGVSYYFISKDLSHTKQVEHEGTHLIKKPHVRIECTDVIVYINPPPGTTVFYEIDKIEQGALVTLEGAT
eukprot:PhF_6_TR42804/c0_g1_i2/m.64797